MSALATVVVARINEYAASAAECFALCARINARAPATHLSGLARLTACAAVQRISLKICAKNSAAGLALGAICLGSGVFDVVLEAGKFRSGEVLIERHWLPAEWLRFGHLEVEQ